MKGSTLFIMKYLFWKLALVVAFMICIQAYGQQRADQTQVQASLWMGNHSYQFEAGSEHEIEILVVPAEDSGKTKIRGLKTSGSKDIRIEITNVKKKKDAFRMRVKIPQNAQSKKHFIVLMGDGPNANLVKGTTFSIQVTQPEATVQN